MTETCDLCHSSSLEPIYEPTTSRRGLTVHLCGDCGLVQSLPRADRPASYGAAASGIADWKNVRSGKDFRSEACISLIRAHADLDSTLCVLDVGSNRGSFVQAIRAAASKALLTCVEPGDDIRLPDGSFDIVRSFRALEQNVSPAATLAEYWRALKPDGLLIIDAPNIALIGSDDIVGEWFIDNHLYHFSRRTLARILEVAGFEIVAGPDSRDHENLLIAARKRKQTTGSVARDYAEVDAAFARITSYVTARARPARRMKSFSLHGRNAVVTRGSRGIGRAIALRLAEVGANVALTYRERVDDAHQVAREIEENGRLAVPLQMDVTDRASIDAAAKEARRALGPISLLINYAGIRKLANIDPVADGDGDAILAATLKGPFRCAQAFLLLLAETKNGAIVHIGSIDSSAPGNAHDATGWAGLVALGEAIARFGAPLSVRSNVVTAGLIASEVAPHSQKAPESIPLKRLGTAREVADAVVFLASDASAYITGQTLNVNGGLYC